MGTYTMKAIEELPAIHDGAVKLAADELGIETFGLQVLDFPAGFSHYPAHDHLEDGQEEVYVVLRGSAGFELDGERVDAGEGTMVRVPAATRRMITPGSSGVRILAIGCAPGGTYVRPDGFRVAVRS